MTQPNRAYKCYVVVEVRSEHALTNHELKEHFEHDNWALMDTPETLGVRVLSHNRRKEPRV